MTQQRPSLHLTVASLYRDGASKILEQLERAHSDTGQAVVWLVGLASTLLVLADGRLPGAEGIEEVVQSGFVFPAVHAAERHPALESVLSR